MPAEVGQFFFLNLLNLSTLEIKQKSRNVNKKTKRYTRKGKKKKMTDVHL